MKKPKYCCFCGEMLKLETLRDETKEKYCSKCDHVFFEAPSPTVIVAVTNADRILLTRSVEWKHPFWGLIAGHLNAEETAEEAAVREVRAREQKEEILKDEYTIRRLAIEYGVPVLTNLELASALVKMLREGDDSQSATCSLNEYMTRGRRGVSARCVTLKTN
jgi:hypothetical protein